MALCVTKPLLKVAFCRKLMRDSPQTADSLDDDLPDNDNEVYESLMETTEYIKKELSMEVCMLGSSLEQDQFIFEVYCT